MKVSAVLVGVNVAATLSVAAQHPACAQDRPNGTANFLRSALTSEAPQPVQLVAAPAKSLTPTQKVSMSDPRSVATRKALAAGTNNGVKLRPFVANRRLPSKADLEAAALASQHAVMDYSDEPTVLDGRVSEYSPYYVSSDAPISARAKYELKQQQKRAESARLRNAASVASTYQRPVAPRAVPGSQPAVPGQVGFPCADSNFNMPVPVTMHQPMNHAPQMHQIPQMQQMREMHQQTPQHFNMPRVPLNQPDLPETPAQPPHLSPQEQLELNKLVDNACIQNGIHPGVVGAGAGDIYARIGPPPFPLSLIPEPAMRDFLKGARSRKSAINSSNLAMASGGGSAPGGAGQLPAGGFRSYLQGGGAGATTTTSSIGFGNYSRLSTAMPVAKHKTHPHSAAKSNHHPKKPQLSAQHNEAPKSNPAVPFTYPPYRSTVNFGS